MRVRRLVTVLSVPALLVAGLSACSEVSEDEMTRLGELPGVEDARRSCSLTCLVSVDVEPDIAVDQLARVLRAVRIIDAKTTDVDVGRADSTAPTARRGVGIRVESGAPAAGDTVIARLATQAVADGSVGLKVTRGRRSTTVSLSAGDGASAMFDAAAAWWPRVQRVPRSTLVAATTTPDGDRTREGGPSRLTARTSFPAERVRTARTLLSSPRSDISGFLVDESRLRVGSSSVRGASDLERAVAALPRARRAGVEVVVASNVLTTRTEDAADDAARRRVIRVAEQVAGVYGSVDDGTVELRAEEARAARTAVERARRVEPSARIPITVTLQTFTEVELGVDGSPALVTLAGRLTGREREVSVQQPNRGSRSAEPDGPDAFVGVTTDSRDGLAATVTAVARRMRGFEADLSLVLSITARDPEDRTPRAMLRVERQDGTWTIVEDPDDRRLDPDASVRRAWAAGS